MKLRAFILAAVLCLTLACATQPSPRYHWMMNETLPDDGVRVWFTETGDHEKECSQQKLSRAEAMASVLVLVQDIDGHKIHYHMKDTDRGFVLTEYLADDKNPGRERGLGRDEAVHYHGLFVDLYTAEKLISATQGHQHGADN